MKMFFALLKSLVSLELWIFHDAIMSCIGHLQTIGLLSYTDLPNVDTFYSTILKTTFAKIRN